MSFSCKVILDSLSPVGSRLTTLEVTFPRYVLAEFNTHRIFSRNSASSRAIPVAKQIEKMEKGEAYIPTKWIKNQKGMQGYEEIDERLAGEARGEWILSRLHAINSAKKLMELGVHKQITNRLLEPHMWHTVIVSSTHWDNFTNLRDDHMADPAIQPAARLIREALDESIPSELNSGDWHLPLVSGVDEQQLYDEGYELMDLIAISAARCARTSYLTHHGKRDPEDDLRLYEDLKSNGHMSPLEHPAMACSEVYWTFKAFYAAQDWINKGIPVGNFHGFIQHRKIIRGEDVYRK